jgi:TonB family protein
MFDFVMSGNRQRRPAKRILASGLTSSLAHVIVLLLLIEYPEILRGGVYQSFRTIWEPPVHDDSQNWRTVAVLPSKMMMPSAEDLKKLRSDSGEKGSKAKPIPIRLNDIQAVLSNQHSKPIVQPGGRVSSPSPPAHEGAAPVAVSTTSGTGSSGTLAGNQNDGKGGQGTASLPSSGLEPTPVVSGINVAPSKIPNTIIASPNIPAVPPKNPSTPGEATKAIRPSDVVLDNDSKGFPMGEYTNLIVELLKEKWFIPSYLKDSQGHTTVHFYIDKNGHTMNVRILAGSGSNPLDIAALNAVLSCNILPALPKGYPGDQVGVRFVFSYNEH